MAYKCDLCGKGKIITKSGRHHRGVAGGKWKNRAPKTKKILLPNLQTYKGKRYCVKCLRKVKKSESAPQKSPTLKSA